MKSTRASGHKPKRIRPARRSTHSMRKEETMELLQELQKLQKQAEKLRWQQALSGSEAAASHRASRLLTGAMQRQASQLADVQAQFSAFGVISPISVPIRLGRERSQRVATLSDIRARQLPSSRAFLARRCGSLDVHKPYSEDQRFEASNGDFCVVRLSVDQFDGARSVRQVFDILLYHYRNLEISITEKLGTVAVREDDDDAQEENIHQNRLVGMTCNNLLVETNTIVFSQFTDKSDEDYAGEGYGIITTEFVDEDELYPYRPDQRVRKDHNMILQLTSYMQHVPSEIPGEDDREELVVVLTRWLHARVHRPEFRVPRATMHELRESLNRFCDSIPRLVRETLRTGVL